MYASPPILNLLVIRSPDIHRAVGFYRAMGLVFELHAHGKGPEHYSAVVNGFVFEIYPLGDESKSTVNARFGFSVDDVDQITRSLVEVGGSVVTEPRDSEWGRRAVVRDLDGHTAELVTPPNRDR